MSTVTRRSLHVDEARQRRRVLTVLGYDVSLDLTGEETFESVTTIEYESGGWPTWCDLVPHRLHRAVLDGRALPAEAFRDGRLHLPGSAGRHTLTVEATMAYRHDGEGLHAHVDPADGRRYLYAMSFMDAAPSIFACFDQPDIKAPYTLHVQAPEGWTVVANAPGTEVEPGIWEFERSRPLSTYFVTVVAGPYHRLSDEHDGIRLGMSARQSLAPHLDADAEELFTLTRQCFDEFHRLFGIRYPFGDYHQAYVPEFNAGAMENPGCVTFRDTLVFSSRVTRGARIRRATTVAHEMAHQWFGNLTTPVWWDDLWLNESFAEYMGNRVTADVTEYADAWTQNTWARRQWGLVADQRPSTHPVAGNGAPDAASAHQDFDGISYVKGSSILRQLNATLGDDVFVAGVVDHLERHRFGNATMHDLLASWERAGAGDLAEFANHWLLAAGPDTLTYHRVDAAILRTPPVDHPADRQHAFRAAVAGSEGAWTTHPVTATGPATPFAVPPGVPVVLDPLEETWALVVPDPETLAALPRLLPATRDRELRASIWNGVRNAFHNAGMSPAQVLDLLAATLPGEENDEALGQLLRWSVTTVVPLAADPAAALRGICEGCVARLATAVPGSTVQLAVFQGLVSATTEAEMLGSWLDRQGLPEGVELDLELRWRVLVRLASLGGVGRGTLAEQLAQEPTAIAQVEHARACAALPDERAKAWAWDHLTGRRDGSNYEIDAIGRGMWRHGQEELTGPYVDRYFADLPHTPGTFSGWMLAEVAEAWFPLTSVKEETVDRARRLAAGADLVPAQRRRVVDLADELARRVAVRRKYSA